MSTTAAVIIALGLIVAAGILVNGALLVVRAAQHRGRGYQDDGIEDDGSPYADIHTSQLD